MPAAGGEAWKVEPGTGTGLAPLPLYARPAAVLGRRAGNHPPLQSPVVRGWPSPGMPVLLSFQQSSIHSQSLPRTV
jgi:hypothetical protein